MLKWLRPKQQNSNTQPTWDEKGRLCLEFRCSVQDGENAFSRMVFPGRDVVKNAPHDWPAKTGGLCSGSLNCRVIDFPADYYDVVGDGDRIAALDTTDSFLPEFEIARDAIKNNRVGMGEPAESRMGIARVWRCAVTNMDSGETFSAWHSRRIDGTYPPFHGIIELVSDRHLRKSHNLENGTELRIQMFSKQMP